MKCARCGHPSQGASWYCANCGAPLTDLNVADSGRRRPLPPVLRWSLWLSAAALGLIGLAALGIGLSRRGGPDEDGRTMEALQAARATAAAEAGPSGEAAPPEASATAAGDAGAVGAGTLDADEAEGAGAAVLRPNGPAWRIARVEVPPSIDGRLEDWDAPFTLAEPVPLSKVVFGTENWDGSADLSAEARAAWDRAALYLGVRVLDEVFSQPARDSLIFRGDSLELQLDTRLAEDFEDGSYSDDDWQLGISPGDLLGGTAPPEAWLWRPSGRAGAIRFPIAARRLDDGYIIEAAIPWALFGLDPMVTERLGFALNVSDNDLPSPEQLTMVSSSPARLWGDPRSFGTLILER